jgi:anti-sigma factor RsiW
VPPRASDYLDGDLAPAEVARVQRHVEQCSQCRELLRGLEEIVTALGSLRDYRDERIAATVLASLKVSLGANPPTGG